ncbi:MAG: hypothetical protein RRY04_07895, partial [Oscillospiraceae bacterium]
MINRQLKKSEILIIGIQHKAVFAPKAAHLAGVLVAIGIGVLTGKGKNRGCPLFLPKLQILPAGKG